MTFDVKAGFVFSKKASIFAENLNLALVLCSRTLRIKQSKLLDATGTQFSEKGKA